MLVVMTALVFIEQSALISSSQLNVAKRSLQALFIRTSGEETMLRKLIDMLRVNHDLHVAFSAISKVSTRINSGVESVCKRISYLKTYVGNLKLTPEESAEFFAPFISFSQTFSEKLVRFNQSVEEYLTLREQEAKRSHELLIVEKARDQLKQRLSGSLATHITGSIERSMKQEMLTTFDYNETRSLLEEARRASKQKEAEIERILLELKAMCQKVMNPNMRDEVGGDVAEGSYEDIFLLFTQALRRFPRLETIKDFIIDYFRLCQTAYGMFVLDLQSFNRAVRTIADNPDEYFGAKMEDEDIRQKREKLRKYEGLIPFLEKAHAIVNADGSFSSFSKNMSEIMSARDVPWEHIGEHLLMAKVTAEADMTTRLNAA